MEQWVGMGLLSISQIRTQYKEKQWNILGSCTHHSWGKLWKPLREISKFQSISWNGSCIKEIGRLLKKTSVFCALHSVGLLENTENHIWELLTLLRLLIRGHWYSDCAVQEEMLFS